MLLLVVFACNWTGYELVPGVVIGPCDLDWHGDRPALVLACPGQDLIRVWPRLVRLLW